MRFNSSLQSFGLGTNSRHFTEAFSFSINPAAIVTTKGICGSIFSERKFSLNELRIVSGTISIKRKQAAVGLEVHTLRWTDLSHTWIGIVYGKSLGRIDLGIRFSYESMKLANYTPVNNIGSEVGALFQLSEKINWGAYFSIPGPSRSTYIYGVGIGYEISENVFVGASMSRQSNERTGSNVGLTYRPAQQFKLKTGLITETRHPYFSAGWTWNHLVIEVAFNYHLQLGVSPGLFLTFQSGEKP